MGFSTFRAIVRPFPAASPDYASASLMHFRRIGHVEQTRQLPRVHPVAQVPVRATAKPRVNQAVRVKPSEIRTHNTCSDQSNLELVH